MMHKSLMGRGLSYGFDRYPYLTKPEMPPEATRTAQEAPKQVDQGWCSLTDIVERLRDAGSKRGRHQLGIGDYWNLCDESADEIERLRAMLEERS